MLDINFIKNNKDKVEKAAQDKGIKINLERLLDLDDKRRTLKVEIDQLRNKKNQITENIKKQNSKPDKKLIQNGREIKKILSKVEDKYRKVKAEYNDLMHLIPLIPSKDTPIGKNEKDNKVVEVVGKKKTFDFKVRNHIQLGKDLDILDLKRGSKVGGYRGYYLKNEGVRLVMGLMNYAIDEMIKKGFTPMIPPTLVKEYSLLGSGYFKGSRYNPDTDNIFQVSSKKKDQKGKESKDKLFLTGTAEPSLLAYHAEEILDKEELPKKLCAYSQCYRSEIGSYGKDTKGHYRVHEFMKVEQVVLCKADKERSLELQQEMMDITKEIYEEIGFTYRTLLMCTGEMDAGKYEYYDIEIWTPGLKRWAETASASNFLDWQSRRLNVRYRDENNEIKYVYMINNTVLPSPRVLIAILENYQKEDGSVEIPQVLRKWVGVDVIKRKK